MVIKEQFNLIYNFIGIEYSQEKKPTTTKNMVAWVEHTGLGGEW